MISITVDAQEVHQALAVLGANLENVQDPLTRLLELGLQDGRHNLESRGVMFNEGWRAMSPWTVTVAARLYGNARHPGDLLEDSGALLASLSPGGPGNILEVNGNQGEAGTGLVSPRSGWGIGSMQQGGTSRTFHVLQGEGFSAPGIPARPFLSWHEERLDQYAEIFSESVWKGVDGA